MTDETFPRVSPLAAAPIAAAERLPTLDILRGISICGIFFLNFWLMGSVPGVEMDPRLSGWSAPDQAVWWFQMVFVEGTMRGLLSLLFGAGFILMADRGASAGRYYRRTALLILFGLIHGYLLLWPGDILLVYGLAGLFLWPLKELEPRQMIGAGIAGLVLLTGLGLGATLGGVNMRALAEAAAERGADETDARVADWNLYVSSISPDRDEIERSLEARSGGVADNWRYKVAQANDLNSFGAARIWIVEPLAMMLIGAALMRLGLMAGEADAGLYRWMMTAGYGLGIPVGLAEWGQMAAADFAAPLPMLLWTDQIGRTATTLGHLGGILWLWRSGRAHRLLRAFAPAGRMALTNYIAQTLIAQWLLFPGFGLGLHAQLSIAELWGFALLTVTAQLAFSRWWLRRFRFGPLEWLWRWGTYLRRPGFAAQLLPNR